jgi:1,2-dihydroxy-3-keto-5-methylthiopentene dioxygenase
MTQLTVYTDTDAARPLARHEDFPAIREALAKIGIHIERWKAEKPLAPTATQDQVIDAYQDSIKKLNQKYGFKSVDVVAMHPEHPQASASRGKFLSEHTHDDFELRFFVDGAGMFYIHKDGKVFMTLCTRGDLIHLPAGTTHWFDMGPKPLFKAIRFFTTPEGWVGNFTGDAIAERFPKYE